MHSMFGKTIAAVGVGFLFVRVIGDARVGARVLGPVVAVYAISTVAVAVSSAVEKLFP